MGPDDLIVYYRINYLFVNLFSSSSLMVIFKMMIVPPKSDPSFSNEFIYNNVLELKIKGFLIICLVINS